VKVIFSPNQQGRLLITEDALFFHKNRKEREEFFEPQSAQRTQRKE
jgi:hypothetical protein